jgi:diguanylate cyclase (GGDEF)-like protein
MIDLDWLNEDTAVSRNTDPYQLATPVPSPQDRPVLTVVNGFNAGQVFALESEETVIGRGREAHVRIEDSGVSRRHSRILRLSDGTFVLEDLGSTNGTFAGGKRIRRIPLRSGDRIQVGPNVSLGFALLGETEERLARQLFDSSTRDALTGVFNRRYLVERVASEIAYANRHRSRLAVVLFDLDHFKQVNDTYGHLAGDDVLRQVTQQVLRTIRVEDVLARYGGEEFVVLVRGIEHPNVVVFGERLRRAIERLVIPWEGKGLRATISVGVASSSECGDMATAEALLFLADERLYRAKNDGRNRVCG